MVASVPRIVVSVDNPRGKLVQIRFLAPVSRLDMATFAHDVKAAIGRLQHVVFVVDCAKLGILPPEQAEFMTRVMRTDNPGVDVSAYLLPPSAVSALQIERMIREADNPRRRAFRTASDLLSFTDGHLDPEERAAAEAFLAAHPQ